MFQEARRDPLRFDYGAASDAQLGVDERGVVDQEVTFPARRRVLIDQGHGRLDQARRQLGRVADRGGGRDELRLAAVEPADATQATQDVRHMRAEDAAVGVHLVDDDIAQVGEEAVPARVVGQDADVEHIWVAQHHARGAADGGAFRWRRVSVVGSDQLVWQSELAQPGHQFGQLVMGQRLRREQVKGAGGGVVEQAVEDRQVIAQRLAGGGCCGDCDVLALGEGCQRCRLVLIELVDATVGQRHAQAVIEVIWPRRVGPGCGRQTPPGGDVAREFEIELESLHGPGYGHGCPRTKGMKIS